MCMKKIIALSCLLFLCSFAGHAQKFALIDMEYILKNIPAYEMTNEQLMLSSRKRRTCTKLTRAILYFCLPR